MEHRPTVMLAVWVGLSVAFLASGVRGEAVASGVRGAAVFVAYPFRAALNAAEDATAYTIGLVFEYDALREENQALHRKFGVLLQHTAQRQELALENDRLRAMLRFDRSEPGFSLLPAEVVGRTRGTLIIDRGTRHGMRESMCVVSADGVVGIITRANLLTSTVATLPSPECVVDAMVQHNRVRGRVRGLGNDLHRLCEMSYIDLKDDVRAGDLVVTSPDSIFPSGFPIGTIVSVEDGPLSQVAQIQPAADAFRLDEVFVVLRADRPWEELAGNPDWANDSGLYAEFLDGETIQERFAP